MLVGNEDVRTERTTIPVGTLENHNVAFCQFPFLVFLLACWVGWFREGLSVPAQKCYKRVECVLFIIFFLVAGIVGMEGVQCYQPHTFQLMRCYKSEYLFLSFQVVGGLLGLDRALAYRPGKMRIELAIQTSSQFQSIRDRQQLFSVS